MKKIILGSILFLFLNSCAWGMDFKIFDMRNKIFAESKEIKESLNHSQDTLVLSSLFNASLLTMSQLDAYFNMLGVFETIPSQDLSDIAVDFLTNWLNEIKSTLDLNISSLTGISNSLEPGTKEHVEKVKYYFKQLNAIADEELKKLAIIKKTAKKKIRR